MLFGSNPRNTLSIATALVCSLCLALIVRADGGLRIVALSGDQVPGADSGVAFSGFDTPVLNAAGQTAFHSYLAGTGVNSSNNSGIYSEGSGSLSEVTRTGNQAPDADTGVVYKFLYSPVLNDVGQTAFHGSLAGPGVNDTNDSGIYSEGGGALAEVTREGNQAPGADSGVVFTSFNSPVFNAVGQTAFLGTLTGSGNTGIYSEDSGTLTKVARANEQAPGGNTGVLFSSFFGLPVLNALGQSAFYDELGGPGITKRISGIYSEGSGTLAEVARTDDQAPDADPGVLFRSFGKEPVLNSAGQTAFMGVLSGPGVDSTNDTGIYSEGGSILAEVVREGTQAPGSDPGVVFSVFDSKSLVINAKGQTSFMSDLTGPGVDFSNNTGIYREEGHALIEVAREGNQVPGADPGVVFKYLNLPTLNAAGQSAFSGGLSGPGVDEANNFGFYATNRDGQLVEIVREGNLIDVNEDPLIEDLRTISVLSMVTNTGNEDGRPSGFNDLGQFAFSASFTDGSQGIFVSNRVAIPEPATAALVVLCLPVLLRRRNRK